MGNCLKIFHLNKIKRPVTILLVGLDNAGKTTAAKGIVGDSIENIAATVGFSPETLIYRGCQVRIYDLGGGTRIRGVWNKYFSEVHGVIFVIDSSDKTRLSECKAVLEQLLSHRRIAGKPVLVLANKQDVEGALDEIDLVESLKIEEMVNKNKCPTRIETCSAMAVQKKKPDKPIADGFRWLIDTIVVNYKSLEKRVQRDLERERKQQMEGREKRKERLRQQAEQREKEEEESNGKSHVPDSRQERFQSDADIVVVQRQLYEPEVINLEDEEAVNNKTSFSDSKELLELGFKHSSSVSSSTSSSSAAPPTSLKASSGSSQVIQVHPSPPAKASPKQGKQQEEENEQHSSNSSAKSKHSLNNLLLSDSFGQIQFQGSPQRSSECVPMDSDDDSDTLKGVVGLDVVPNGNGPQNLRNNVEVTDTTVIASATAGVKEQIELEASLHKKTKRKNFLKRLHRTAPATVPSSVADVLVCP